MPLYRIHRLKAHLRASFRYAPHTSGKASVKPRDYEPAEAAEAETIDAESPYAAFFARRDGGSPLEVGDLLESESGVLTIFKFVGFEQAEWLLPAPKPEQESAAEREPEHEGSPAAFAP